jgi:hypothetical protein
MKKICAAALLVLWPVLAGADDERVTPADLEEAIAYYKEGSSVCFRLAPPTGADKEKQWTLVVLTARSNTSTSFMFNALELAAGTRVKPETTVTVWRVMKKPDDRKAFFERFGAEMEKKVLRALLLKTPPVGFDEPVDFTRAREMTPADLRALAAHEVWHPQPAED